MGAEKSLQKAISHHKAGETIKAEKLYRAILSEDLKQPDANHNLGVLLKQRNQLEAALGYFKTALEAHPNQSQFWISYIDTLITLGQFDTAKNIIKKGQSNGLEENRVDQFTARIKSESKTTRSKKKTLQTAIKPHRLLARAKSHAKKGEAEEASKLYSIVLEAYPENQQAKKGLEAIHEGNIAKVNRANLPQAQFDTVVSLYSSGQFKKALKFIENLSKDYPNESLLHNVSGACYGELGQLEEAVKCYREAIAVKPIYYEAHYNLGVTLNKLGKLESAVKSYEQALVLKPDYAEAHSNLGNTLGKLGQLDAAIGSYKQAIAFKPDYVVAHNNIGVALSELDLLDAAVKSYEQALALKPDYAEAHTNLGNTLRKQGQLEAAVKSHEQALALKPDLPSAHYNLANTVKELGQYDAAIMHYKKALAISPVFAEAQIALGYIFKELGKIDAAIESYTRGLTLDPGNNLYWAGFSHILRNVRYLSYNETASLLMLEALKKPTVHPKDICTSVISILRHHPKLIAVFETIRSDGISESTNILIEQLASIPLLLQLMETCPIPDPEIEYLLTQIRMSMLSQLATGKLPGSAFSFCEALALHCFANEYIFLETNKEKERIEQLGNEIGHLVYGNKPIPALNIAMLATYRPLHIFPWADQLIDVDSTNRLYKILNRHVLETKEERCLRFQIENITPIGGEVSQSVREQYEENPYPRWINVGLTPEAKTVKSVMQTLKLDIDFKRQQFPLRPNVLIAGCGTGQHALGTASRFSDCSVLAIDLSLSSLSYARRRTRELSVSNIEYKQADILKLTKLGRQFDIIESAGVLHHMEDPLAGWKALVDLLKPQGLMKIGLYSEIARQHIVEIREFISKKEYNNTPEDIRQCRSELVNMAVDSESGMRKIVNSPDFYSLSGCRDLLFHVQEHRFTLPQIERALEELGLIFIGFELENSQTIHKFRALYPGDEDKVSLSLWHQFELENPDTFSGMYQFWVRKAPVIPPENKGAQK